MLGTCKAIWCELFQYLTAHLHLDKDYEAFKILVIDNLIDYWQPLTSEFIRDVHQSCSWLFYNKIDSLKRTQVYSHYLCENTLMEKVFVK